MRQARAGALGQEEYAAVYAKVPRLTVEVVLTRERAGVVLSKRSGGPCDGLWHLPGGTVRYGEPLVDAVRRVALAELGLAVRPKRLLGYIEYPSHLARGIDWPVGMAFETTSDGSVQEVPGSLEWFEALPFPMHEEQRVFLLSAHLGLRLR